MEAICECVGQLWVPGWPCMHSESASQSLPHSSASQSLVVVDMQMDAHLKKEQIGTLFDWVGALGSSPNSICSFLQKNI